MADQPLIERVQELSDLELAVLICLVAREHCIIDTEPGALDDIVEELELIASKTFGLSSAVVDCSEHTSLDDFANAILSIEGSPPTPSSPVRSRQDKHFLDTPGFASLSRSPPSESFGDNRTIANLIIAKNLDDAPKTVQIQALELIRTHRIYTRTSVQAAPKRFLILALLGGGEGPRLTKHLNDHMFISHFHDPDDGYANIEELYGDEKSISSVVKNGKVAPTHFATRITETEVDYLTILSEEASVSVEVKQYQQNIIAFLRVHRVVSGGITATATKHFDKLAKCLAPLHDLTYVTPSHIALAARKIYAHRIQTVNPERDRSMQWGSEISAVAALLDGIGVEDVIEEVLTTSGAEAPL